MSATHRIARLFFNLGLVGLAYAWILIIAAAMFNPWFRFTANAFSDLGSASANVPWFFNYGMISVGTLICLYSWSLVVIAENKTESTGGVFFLVSGGFLILIGYFHEGTYPHLFVSYWFFIQSALAIIAWGAGMLFAGRMRSGTTVLLLGLISPVAGALIHWPSTAVLEAFGIVVIDIWTAIVAITMRNKLKRGSGSESAA